MSDDDEPSHFLMDEAFCARMRMAIEAGLESAPIGVVTTHGTKNPKYVPTEPRLLGFSPVEMDVWLRAATSGPGVPLQHPMRVINIAA